MQTKAGLTKDDFEKLLAWFHSDREQAAERYEITRLKLREWFARRGSGSADELADVVLDRVARLLARGEEIRGPAFFIAVARNVFLESLRSGTNLSAAADQVERADSNTPEQLLTDAEDAAAGRLRIAAMVGCLRELPPDELMLVSEYYRDGARGTRARIAKRLGVSTSSLYLRMHRLCKRLTARLDAVAPASAVKEVAAEPHKK